MSEEPNLDEQSFFNDLPIPEEIEQDQDQKPISGYKIDNVDDFIKYKKIMLKDFEVNHRAELQKKHSGQDIELRQKHAKKVSIFSLCWCSFIVLIILMKAFCPAFKINQTEFLFVCGTLTTSILAFYLVIIKNLFPNNKRPKKPLI